MRRLEGNKQVPKDCIDHRGTTADGWKPEFAILSVIFGDYFRVMRIPLLEGRYFSADDRSYSQPVVIVNESMAKHCWPGERAVGKRMLLAAQPALINI